MSRSVSNRHLAAALLKTLRRLEADPSIDQNESAFIQLKCTLLQRLLHLESGSAEAESEIHMVESPRSMRLLQFFEPEPRTLTATEDDESAIA